VFHRVAMPEGSRGLQPTDLTRRPTLRRVSDA
jgi:hypothetical protein